MCVFVYSVDNETEPASEREPMTFKEVYLGQVNVDDFRRNARGELGTRTATLDRYGKESLVIIGCTWHELRSAVVRKASSGMALVAISK